MPRRFDSIGISIKEMQFSITMCGKSSRQNLDARGLQSRRLQTEFDRNLSGGMTRIKLYEGKDECHWLDDDVFTKKTKIDGGLVRKTQFPKRIERASVSFARRRRLVRRWRRLTSTFRLRIPRSSWWNPLNQNQRPTARRMKSVLYYYCTLWKETYVR